MGAEWAKAGQACGDRVGPGPGKGPAEEVTWEHVLEGGDGDASVRPSGEEHSRQSEPGRVGSSGPAGSALSEDSGPGDDAVSCAALSFE